MDREPIAEADRLSVRFPPPGRPIMYQSWGGLLFMHWPVPAHSLRPLIPDALAIDTYDGVAWIGITPFTTWGLRPVLLPAVPLLSESHEINVRTYVHLDGIPGVWFLSLDANNPLAVWGARLAFHLPYFAAHMGIERQDRTINFASKRTHRHAPSAEFEASWRVGDKLPQPEPDSLDFFLFERYCLYAARKAKLYRADLSQTLAPAHGAPALVPFDYDRIAGAAFARGRAAAAPARRLFEGSDLATGEGSVAFLAEMSGRAPNTGAAGIIVRQYSYAQQASRRYRLGSVTLGTSGSGAIRGLACVLDQNPSGARGRTAT